MEENDYKKYKKYKMTEAAREGTKIGIIVGLFLLCVFLLNLGGILYTVYNGSTNKESQSMDPSESTTLVKSYNDDMIEVISRKAIYDDNSSPVVYIVKDKETSKEYIIFRSNKGDNIQVFPR